MFNLNYHLKKDISSMNYTESGFLQGNVQGLGRVEPESEKELSQVYEDVRDIGGRLVAI